jgi:addiction module HigA family antidote
MSTYSYQPDYAMHPGETLREKLEELQMTPNEFAIRTSKPIQTISKILNGKSSITFEMAVQFEKAINISANFWTKKQAHYNEFLAKEKYKQDIVESQEWAKLFPYAQMAKFGIVKASRKIEEKTEELLDFFDVSKHTAWENIYFNQKTPVYFRISLKHTKNPFALSVLLQMGELRAKKIQAPAFSKVLLKDLIPKLKTVMVENPDNFLQIIQQLCLTAGVKVIYTPNLKQTVTNGVVRWIDENPVVQMTDRYKKYDIFWFSFFHELGHIVLHGNKKNIFLEESSATKQSKEELEADMFAGNILLSDKEYNNIKNVLETENNISNALEYYANKYNTHKDIILGRFLKENNEQKYKFLYSKIQKVDFQELLNYNY